MKWQACGEEIEVDKFGIVEKSVFLIFIGNFQESFCIAVRYIFFTNSVNTNWRFSDTMVQICDVAIESW